MPRRIDLTRAQVDEIARLARDGWGSPRIATAVGLSDGKVAQVLRDLRSAGVIEPRSPGGVSPSEQARRDRRDEQIRRLRAQGLTEREVAEQLGVGRATVSRVAAGLYDGRVRRAEAVADRRRDVVRLARQGLTTRQIAAELGVPDYVVQVDLRVSTSSDWHADRRLARAQRVAQAHALAAAGESIEAIAAELEVRPRTVRQYLGVDAWARYDASRDAQIRAWHAEGVTLTEIGRRLGVSRQTVRILLARTRTHVRGRIRRAVGDHRRAHAVRLRDAGSTPAEIAAALEVAESTVAGLLTGAPPRRRAG